MITVWITITTASACIWIRIWVFLSVISHACSVHLAVINCIDWRCSCCNCYCCGCCDCCCSSKEALEMSGPMAWPNANLWHGNAAPKKIYQLPQNCSGNQLMRRQKRRRQQIKSKAESRVPKKPVRQCSKNETGCTEITTTSTAMKTKGVLDQKYIYLFCCNFIPPFIFFFLFFWWASLAVSAEIASGHKLTAWGPDIFAHRCKWLVSECRYKYGCRYRCRCRYRCIEGRRTQTNAKRDKHTQNHLKSTMMTLMSVPTPLNPPNFPLFSPHRKRHASWVFKCRARPASHPRFLLTDDAKIHKKKFEKKRIKNRQRPRPHPKTNNKGDCNDDGGSDASARKKAPPQSQKCAIWLYENKK